MTTKQILLSAFILGAMSTIALATQQANRSTLANEMPNLLLIHTLVRTELGYEQNHRLKIKLTPIDQATLELIKEAHKENDFIVCPLSINGQSKKVRVYNPNSPFINEFNTCEFLKEYLAQAAPEQIAFLAQGLALTK